MENKLSYDELRSKCDDFQARIISLIKTEQDLADTQTRLEVSLLRFKSIQDYSKKVTGAKDIEEFANMTVESLVEIFEVECSAFFIYDKPGNDMVVKSYFGFDDNINTNCRLDSEWISSSDFLKSGKVIIEQVEPNSIPFGKAGLYKIILSPYYEKSGNLHVILSGGVSIVKREYYDEITEQMIPSFTLFTQQMGIMLQEFETRRLLGMKVHKRKALVSQQKKEIEALKEEIIKQKNELGETQSDMKLAKNLLIQSEKMASLGHLVADIAHEINNPVNFINAGIDSLSTNLEEIWQVLEVYHKINVDNLTEKLKEIDELKQKVRYKENIREINKLINSIKNGTKRTTEIVKGLQTFSRHDEGILMTTDIHEGIDSTLVLLHNKYKNRIEIIKKYGGIPLIECYPGQLNQVFMNILSNAVDAIDATGTITISTYIAGENLIVSIQDTGHGIPENLKSKIFNPFFTTKSVGKGTGLGLSITRSIIEKHQGKISFTSEVGKGSEFILMIPVKAGICNN